MTRRELEITDKNEILQILEKSKVLHLALVDKGMPYIVPMNYGYEMDENGNLEIYLHGATKGYKLDIIRDNPICCFEIECDVTPFEGKMPCQYGTSYASLIGRGRIEIINTVNDKIKMLSKFMKSQTGKDFEFNEKLVSIVSIMKITVNEYSAKRRPLPATLRGEAE